MKQIIPSINLHLTKYCNMKCKYCFAKFNKTTFLYPTSETLKLISLLKEFGFEKINFVGGEPLLIPEIKKLIKFSKENNLFTSIVTNGALLTDEFLVDTYKYIDQIGLSIDSLEEKTNFLIGRTLNNIPMNIIKYYEIVNKINKYNIDLKINTVVSALNYNEKMYNFINYSNVKRWKVFQVLKIQNENDKNFKNFEISNYKFNYFCKTQLNKLNNQNLLIKENNSLIKGSYLMINPNGNFFDNSNGKYTVSDKIIEVGVEKTLNQINFDYNKFILRDGYYFKNDIKQLAI